MANLIATADGNLTSSSTWGVVDTTSFLESETGNTAISTTPLSSATFTPGAITVDGIALRHRARATSPTGTFTVTLRNNTDAVDVVSVTINVSDLATGDSGWHFYKFASQLLLAGKAYLVKVVCSNTGSQVTLYRNATANNWARMLRTTTTAAPGAGDNMHICNEKTGAGASTARSVTMDSTASTDYGSSTLQGFTVNQGGTLTWGTTAATNYVLRLSTILRVNQGGTWNQGTTGTPIPRDSTAILEFDCASDGQFGAEIGGGTANIQGLSRTSGKDVSQCLLSADVAVAGTTLNVNADTGWLSGDEIAIASTTRTRTQSEERILNGNAGASSMAITAGLTYAHDGGSSNAKITAEVILLTRNVKIRAVTSTNVTYFNCDTEAVVDVDWCEFRYMGTLTANKVGVGIYTTTGSVNFNHCSLRNFERYGFFMGTNADNWSITNCVLYDCMNVGTGNFAAVQISSSSGVNWTLSNVTSILSTSYCFYIASLGGTISNVRGSGATYAGFALAASFTGYTIGTITAHSNGTEGVKLNVGYLINMNFGEIDSWRNNAEGIAIYTGYRCTFETGFLVGNTPSNLDFDAGSGTGVVSDFFFNNYILSADTSFSTTNGLNLDTLTGPTHTQVTFNNCQFSPTGGLYSAHTNDITVESLSNADFIVQIELQNCKLGASTTVNGQANMGLRSWISSMNHNQSATQHKKYFYNGNISCDTTNYGTASPGQTLDPSDATYKLKSGSIYIPVASGGTVTVGVGIKELNSYNGNDARLMVRRNDLLGVTSDTVVDTATAAPETLSGSVGPVSADGVLEFYVDCDGTVGEINVDDWTVTGQATDTGAQVYWVNGTPIPAIIPTPTGGGGTRAYIS